MSVTFSPIAFNPIFRPQPINYAQFGQTPIIVEKEGNNLLSQSSENDRNLKILANLIRANKKQEKLPDFKDIEALFNSYKFDPRNLKKGDEIILNLGGKDYKFKIEKDGEFFCKVRGRDDSVHIYVGKNKFGKDCICLEHRYKKTESNMYVTYYKRIPIEEYDN